MNIFVLSLIPKLAAQAMCDKHVVKMVLEYTQILCAVHRISAETSCTHKDKVDEAGLYKITHRNHPCVQWARESDKNYIWLCSLLGCTLEEYTYRYKRVHKCESLYSSFLGTNLPAGIPITPCVTPFRLVVLDEDTKRKFGKAYSADKIPTQSKSVFDAVKAYRVYYARHKSSIAKWAKGRLPPKWWVGETCAV